MDLLKPGDFLTDFWGLCMVLKKVDEDYLFSNIKREFYKVLHFQTMKTTTTFYTEFDVKNANFSTIKTCEILNHLNY